jgi:nicotinamidase/pyrazinamidase
MAGSSVFFDIDTQVDFMLPHGALYVPGAEALIPNLVRLMSLARERDILVISPPTPTPDDPGCPLAAHCVAGTPASGASPKPAAPPRRRLAFRPPERCRTDGG